MWFASPHPKHPAVGGGGRALKGLGGSPEAIGVAATTGAGAGGITGAGTGSGCCTTCGGGLYQEAKL